MSDARRTIAAIGLLSVLAACQPLPQPFQPAQSKKETNPLLRLPDRAGILIRPVKGLPPDTAQSLSVAIAASLVKRNIPAFTETGNPGSLILGGRVVETAGVSRIDWRLLKKDGDEGDTHRIVTAAPTTDSETGNPDPLKPIADRAAAAIAKTIQNPTLQDRTATAIKRYLHVSPIAGPPEAAAKVLRAEIEAALRRNALRVSARPRDNSLVVAGSVSLSDADAGRKHISVVWAVLRKDGHELGKLTQSNQVAPEELDRDWPTIARGIAVSAAQGLRQLLNKIPEKAIEPPKDKG